MLTGLAQKAQYLKYLVRDNSSTILTGVGVGGTIATAYLTGRATFKAADLIAKEQEKLEEDLRYPDTQIEQTRVSKIKLVWKLYIPPVGTGLVTISSIIMANKISSRKIAALTAASAISERALQEYKSKVLEKFGERQSTTVRDEIAQDRVNKNPVNSQVVIVGSGEVLCMDSITGRYFLSSVEEIKRAENKINRDFINHMYASLSEFYDELGVPPTSYTDSVGWNGDEPLKVLISTTVSSDNRPCLVVDFNRPPILEYGRVYN